MGCCSQATAQPGGVSGPDNARGQGADVRPDSGRIDRPGLRWQRLDVTDISISRPAAFDQPQELAEALRLLADGPRTILAGGTDLYPATARQALEGDILDITEISGLRGIHRDAQAWRIGAATPWADIIAADLPPAFDALKQAAGEVGSVQIQAAGTVGGNLCNASPAADGVPPLLVLDAEIAIAGPTGRRQVPLAEFITGPRQTALAPGELVTGLVIPEEATGGRSGFLKLGARAYLVISIAMVAARIEIAAGRIADLALSVGACSAVATRLTAVEASLIGAPVADIDQVMSDAGIIAALSPISDIRGSDTYRAEAAATLIRRVLADLVRAGPGGGP